MDKITFGVNYKPIPGASEAYTEVPDSCILTRSQLEELVEGALYRYEDNIGKRYDIFSRQYLTSIINTNG